MHMTSTQETVQSSNAFRQQHAVTAQKAQRLEKENEALKKEHRDEIDRLCQHVVGQNQKIQQLSSKLHDTTCEKDASETVRRELEEKLKQKTDECESLRQNKKCRNTCVLDLIVLICCNFIGICNFNPCDRGLERVLSYQAAHENIPLEDEDLKCTHLMNILQKLGVVEEHDRFDYPPRESNLRDHYTRLMLYDAWKIIMGMDSSKLVVLLGRVGSQPNDEGHCVLSPVYDLNQKINGKITIYDPQRKVSGEHIKTVNQEDFINYLIQDNGLILYTVNIEKLQEIIRNYSKVHVLSCTDKAPAIFLAAGTGGELN